MIYHSHTLSGGWMVELHTNGNGNPPDYRGMAPASCSIWIRFNPGPSGWWRPELKCAHKVRALLDECESVVDVTMICSGWWPSWEEVKRADL